MIDMPSYTLLNKVWERKFYNMENVKLEGLWKDTSKLNLYYKFYFELTTKRKQKVIAHISLSEYKGSLQVGFSTQKKTQELHKLASGLVDKIVNEVEYLDTILGELKEVNPVLYPKHYISKSILEERKNESKGIRVSSIRDKKELIVNFFEELKCKKLPEVNYSDNERRSFEIRGRGSTNLGKLLVELGIAKEFKATKVSKSFHTIYFKDDCYNSHLYTVLDQWESFIRNEIGFQDCFSSRYFV